ncbi:MAG TPA: flagellar motor protein, partial [Lysobacter sp.]
MDKLSVIAVVLALVALVGGSVLKGAGLAGLWSPAAFVIVIVGTFAAIMLQTPSRTFRHAWSIAGWVFHPPRSDTRALVALILEWSTTARRQGLLALETEVDAQADAFVRKGLQMVVDGVEPEAIRQMLDIEVQACRERDLAAAKVFEGMGVYAPTLGIIGTVLGLIHVLENLSEPEKLGHLIAGAFVATLWGVMSANVFWLPLSNKLKRVSEIECHHMELILEGVLSVQAG